MNERVATSLRRYADTEPEIHAWVEVNPQPPLGHGPLDGVPFGVKDIIETGGLATEYGSSLYRNRKGDRDAAVVNSLRRAGAVLFGKTQTTAFAYFDPPPTRNPRNLSHTPGGSSSGSAAAVAAGVVPFALGTQTMGSVIRPASFCGVTGFKPTFGVLPTDGVLPFAPSLDTVGFLADSVETCRDVWLALGFNADERRMPVFCTVEDLPPVSPEMQSAFDRTVSSLRTQRVRLPHPYTTLLTAARTINDFEGARSHYERWREFGDRIGEKLAALVQRGMQIPQSEYEDSLGLIRDTKAPCEGQVLLTPAAMGAAPEGLASTGDPAMNAVWTALGAPALTIPMQTNGLPLGLQLIAAPHADALVLGGGLLAHVALQGR